MSKRAFNVAIVHGHSHEVHKLKSYVRSAGFTPRLMIEEYKAGVIFNRWRDMIWDDVHCALVLLTNDDRMASRTYRARQNAIFELGYCFGAFDSLDDDGSYTAEDAIVVIKETGVELFADVAGLTTIEFKKGQLGRQKKLILSTLATAFEQAKTFYSEL